jgi:hypothetical protein
MDRGIHIEQVTDQANQYSSSKDTALWHLDNSEFVRLRKCRRRVVGYFLDRLREMEDGLHEHMKKRSESILHSRDPVGIRKEARRHITFLFEIVVFSRVYSVSATDSSPILGMVGDRNTLSELEQFCYEAPVQVDGVYRAPRCSRTLNEELGPLFWENWFFGGSTRSFPNVADLL